MFVPGVSSLGYDDIFCVGLGGKGVAVGIISSGGDMGDLKMAVKG